jgi:hypothetical protein
MPIWSGGEPKHPLVTYPLDMTPGAEFEVNVTVEGRAVEGALVCVQDGGSVYETGRTDATGIARLTVPVGSPPGEVTLTVSEGHDPAHADTAIRHAHLDRDSRGITDSYRQAGQGWRGARDEPGERSGVRAQGLQDA